MILINDDEKNMYQVKIISAGVKKIAKIEKLYNYLGPLCLTYGNDKDGFPVPIARFDNIESIEVVNDLSTRKIVTSSEGNSVTTAKTGNMVKRAVIGGVLTGGAGAVIGGVTGTKNTEVSTISNSSETIKYLVTLQVKFKDGKVLIISVNDPEITELLYSHIGTECISDDELEILKQKSLTKIANEKRAIEERSRNAIFEQRAKEKIAMHAPMESGSEVNMIAFASFMVGLILCYFTHSDLGFKLFTLIWFFIKLIFFTIVAAIPITFYVMHIGEKKRQNYSKLLAEEISNQKIISRNKKSS